MHFRGNKPIKPADLRIGVPFEDHKLSDSCLFIHISKYPPHNADMRNEYNSHYFGGTP